MTEYPAITLWQPWASLIAIGAMPMEFRSRSAPPSFINRRIAIHAGARAVRQSEVRDLLLTLHSSFWRETGLIREPAIKFLEPVLLAPRSLPLSVIVCTAILGTPIRNNELVEKMGLPTINDSDRTEHTNYGWPLTEILPLLPPEPASGRKGWWTWRTGS